MNFIEKIEYEIRGKTRPLTVISIFYKSNDESLKQNILKLKEKHIKNSKTYISLFEINEKNCLRIFIDHENESFQDVEKHISNIISGNDSFLFLYNGLNEYYSFLTEVIMKFFDIKVKEDDL